MDNVLSLQGWNSSQRSTHTQTRYTVQHNNHLLNLQQTPSSRRLTTNHVWIYFLENVIFDVANIRPVQPNTSVHVLRGVKDHAEMTTTRIFLTHSLTLTHNNTHTHSLSLSINGCCHWSAGPHLDPIGLRKGWTQMPNKSLLPRHRTVNRPSTAVSEEVKRGGGGEREREEGEEEEEDRHRET